jgi:membrane protein
MSGGGRPKRPLKERIEGAKESALARAQRAPRPVLRIALTFLHDLMAIEPFDRAMTLAAQAFVSVFPLLIIWATFAANGTSDGADQLAEKLHLSESVAAVLDQSLPPDTEASTTFGVISALIVLVSATSLSRALGRMYAKAWHVPPSGWGDGWRWVLVIVAISAAAVATQYLSQSQVGAAALFPIFLVNTALYTWVPWLLLMRRVSVLRLLPAAALMGIGSAVLSVAGHLYLPHALKVGAEHFGAFGLAFAFIGWLFVLSFVLIVATVLGAVIVQDEGVEGLVLAVRRRVASLFGQRSETSVRDDPGDAPADR